MNENNPKPVKEYQLQARDRSLSTIRDANGDINTSTLDLIQGQYLKTPYAETTRKRGVDLLQAAREGEFPEFPPAQYKFRIKKVMRFGVNKQSPASGLGVNPDAGTTLANQFMDSAKATLSQDGVEPVKETVNA